jgi:uncharacterized phage-associated protein
VWYDFNIMTTALDVTKHLIELAAREPDEAEPVTHMRVQKLLYYAQGWHLGLFGRPLFSESLRARKNGPIVLEVEETLRAALGDNPARPLAPADLGPANLSGRDKVFLETVWQKYRAFSATGLKELSHVEAPWVEARGALPETAESQAEITPDSLSRFFGSRPEALAAPAAALEEVYAAEVEDRAGGPKGVAFEELRRRRRAGETAKQEQV